MSFSLPGISGLSFDSPFLSPLLFCCLVLLLFLFGHFSVHSCDVSPENSPAFLLLRDRIFCTAIIEQLEDDSWCVQFAVYISCIYIYMKKGSVPFLYFIIIWY